MKQNWWKLLIVVLVAVAVVAAVALKNKGADSKPPVSVAKTETATSSETKPPAPTQTDVVEVEKPKVEASKPEDAGTAKPRTATTKPSTSTPAKPTAKPQPPKPKPQPKQLPKMLELGADKCTPCKMMKPVMAELRKEYAGKLEIEFIDVWKNQSAAEQYGIDTIPTQIFFDASGKEFARHVGFFPKDEIVATFKDHGVAL